MLSDFDHVIINKERQLRIAYMVAYEAMYAAGETQEQAHEYATQRMNEYLRRLIARRREERELQWAAEERVRVVAL